MLLSRRFREHRAMSISRITTTGRHVPSRHLPSRLLVIATIGLATLSACGTEQPEAAGANGSNDGIASLDDTDDPADDTADVPADGDSDATGTTIADTGDELEAPEDIEEAMTLFQSCMTEHGVEGGGMVMATRAEDGGTIQVGNVSEDDEGPVTQIEEIDPEVFEAANEACSPHLANAMPEFDLTPEQEAALEDARLEFEACMKEAGVEMPEMSTSDGGATMSINVSSADADGALPAIGIDDIDFDAFNEAAEGCQSVYDDYPELDDVMGGAGSTGGFVVSNKVSAP